jgi:CAAX prenyl protease-like protein
MAVERLLALPPQIFYPIRLVLSSLTLLLVSRRCLSLRPGNPVTSIGIGIAVFLLWIAPDALFAYRHTALFENFVTGRAESSLSAARLMSLPFVLLRALSSTLLVPVLEELFWRGWLMRWFIEIDFLKVPLGTYAPSAFWLVAVLFAAEHGPYWEVGLAAGIVYNWWIIRTGNLADCILAHAVTNGALSVYVVAAHQWQYWL